MLRLLLGLASSVDSSMCVTCQKRRPMDAAVTRADGLRQASSVIQWSDAHGAFQGFESISNREMSETGRTVPDMDEPLSRYDVTVTVAYGGSHPDPAAFAAAADQAAWRRSASIISAHLADKIISVVTVTAPDRHAAVAVARAVVSDALNRQALSSNHSADDRAEPAA
jgi:hypothetical protein